MVRALKTICHNMGTKCFLLASSKCRKAIKTCLFIGRPYLPFGNVNTEGVKFIGSPSSSAIALSSSDADSRVVSGLAGTKVDKSLVASRPVRILVQPVQTTVLVYGYVNQKCRI